MALTVNSKAPSFCGKIPRLTNKAKAKAFGLVPNTEISNETLLNAVYKTGAKISSAEQRLILGATALMTQPFIDYHNKKVDDETRKVSVARTVAKIIAGTATGFLIRKGCIKAIDVMSKIPAAGVPKWKTIFTPKGITDNKTEAFQQYKNAMGTIVALFVMMFTNFLVDAPLTKFLTNLLVQKHNEKSMEGKS